MSLDASTGAISGTPTTAGTYSFVEKVADSLTAAQTYTDTLSLSITIAAASSGGSGSLSHSHSPHSHSSSSSVVSDPPPSVPSTPASAVFTLNRHLYETGEDIRQLQAWLNSRGHILAASGPGSVGNETSFFGPLTFHALASFQAAQGLPATGYFGPLTRALIAGLR